MSNPFESQTAGLPQQFTQMTLEPEQLCHYLRDDELERLGEMHQDPVKDICLAAIGVFFGALIPAFDALRRFGDAKHPMTRTDMISVAMTFMFLGIILVTAFLWMRKAKSKKSFIQMVRDRPKVPVKSSGQ